MKRLQVTMCAETGIGVERMSWAKVWMVQLDSLARALAMSSDWGLMSVAEIWSGRLARVARRWRWIGMSPLPVAMSRSVMGWVEEWGIAAAMVRIWDQSGVAARLRRLMRARPASACSCAGREIVGSSMSSGELTRDGAGSIGDCSGRGVEGGSRGRVGGTEWGKNTCWRHEKTPGVPGVSW